MYKIYNFLTFLVVLWQLNSWSWNSVKDFCYHDYKTARLCELFSLLLAGVSRISPFVCFTVNANQPHRALTPALKSSAPLTLEPDTRDQPTIFLRHALSLSSLGGLHFRLKSRLLTPRCWPSWSAQAWEGWSREVLMLIKRPLLSGSDVSLKLLQVFKRLVKRDADAEANPEADPHRFWCFFS